MSRLFTTNDGDYISLPWGVLTFHNNEWHLETSVDDPAGISFIGSHSCKISYKNRNRDEVVLLQLKVRPDGMSGEIYVGCLDKKIYDLEVSKGNPKALDKAMIEVATINTDGVEFRVPVRMSAGFSGSQSQSQLTSPDGRYMFQVQDDRNLVGYDMTTNPPTPFWNSGTEVKP